MPHEGAEDEPQTVEEDEVLSLSISSSASVRQASPLVRVEVGDEEEAEGDDDDGEEDEEPDAIVEGAEQAENLLRDVEGACHAGLEQ